MAKRIMISGGGTGGHIFPAIAIANALRRLDPATDILFVGAKGRMEMEKVPAAGYKIEGLDIQGFQRKSVLKNLLLPFKILSSISKASSLIKSFKPDAVVGVGGYASGPLLYTAAKKNIPYLVQEQNSYAGMTNKRLGLKASRICVAFDGMDRFFPGAKILKTGNPIRRESVAIEGKRAEALAHFGLSTGKKTILLTGGSLGAGTLNKSMLASVYKYIADDIQVIWQTGKYYYKWVKEEMENTDSPNIHITEFLNRMDYAYAAADLIIARAGAGTIAELCMVKKPVILIPSPNVAEDHQTKNAMALVEKGAAILIHDDRAVKELLRTSMEILGDASKAQQLSEAIGALAMPDADDVIALEVFKIAGYSK